MNSQEPEERLQEIIAAYLEAEESGNRPERGEFLARYPEWQSELELFLSNREKLVHAFGQLGGLQMPSLTKSEREISTPSSASARHDPQVGDTLVDRWNIQQIFTGGMGIVYVLYDESTHELLAAKTFQPSVFEKHPAVAPRFQREAATWIALSSHSHVIQARFV